MDSLEYFKNILNQKKIKLWSPPYLEEDGKASVADMLKLASELSCEFSQPEAVVQEILSTLQQKAIENLKERDKFQSTGVATLKVRFSFRAGEIKNFSLKLNERGGELKRLVAEYLGDPQDKLKLIGRGRVIADEEALEKQGIKNGMQIMALLIRSSGDDLKAFEDNDALLNTTKRDVGLLSDSIASNGENYLQITDQFGKPLSLPASEQKALVLAMTLHEKGKAALKKENFSLALFLLLEAEKEFSCCNSSLLQQVDNYGLLNLDVAWCYLCLQSFALLPDAAARLQKCEQAFQKAYGTNLERLMAVKGSSASEGALYLRLHLLQAIVFYHQNKFVLARERLKIAEDELRGLKVDDETLSQLLDLGYTITESRVALRESKGNIGIAVSIIENKRAERERVEKEAEKERLLNKERKKLGKCKDGSWVEPNFHKALTSMGYSSATATWALAETNNRISDAVSLIQDHPERLPPAPVSTHASEESVKQLVALGFDAISSTAALAKHPGNMNKILDELTKMRQSLPNMLDAVPSTSSGLAGQTTSTATTELFKSVVKKLEKTVKKKEEEDAYSRVAEGLSASTDDYLDLALTTEETYLLQYKELLEKQTQEK